MFRRALRLGAPPIYPTVSAKARSTRLRCRCRTCAVSTCIGSRETLRTHLFVSFIAVQRGARCRLDHRHHARANGFRQPRLALNHRPQIRVILHQKRPAQRLADGLGRRAAKSNANRSSPWSEWLWGASQQCTTPFG